MSRLWAALLLILVWAEPARPAEPSAPFTQRAGELVRVINGETSPEKFFSPAFLGQVPAERMNEISAQLRASYGRARAVARVEPDRPDGGALFIAFERATVRMQMAVGAQPPHLVEGLLVVGAESSAADLPALVAEFVALPGEASLSADRLEVAGPASLLTQQAERPLAIGSAFKLFILAELVRQVKAGERRWSDVVPLGAPSLPSGFLRDWPRGSPMTLHSLAALMISQSDNSATDTLLAVIGREKVERLLPALGVREPGRNRPFLSTREAFALKLGDPKRLAEWKASGEPGRRALLARMAGEEAAKLDPLRHGGRPAAIGSVEWFASPADLVRTLDWLRRNGDSTALDLLAINPGLGAPAAERFAYFGFKGGSEPGVLNMSFLLKTREGGWRAVSATWNNESAPLDEPGFAALISRLIALLP